MTYTVRWEPPAPDQIADLAKTNPEAPDLIVTAAYELEDEPRPTNSVALGTSNVRRLLLGYYRITYEIFDETAEIKVYAVGRSDLPR